MSSSPLSVDLGADMIFNFSFKWQMAVATPVIRATLSVLKVYPFLFTFTGITEKIACVAAGPRTRLNHLNDGLERLRRRQGKDNCGWVIKVTDPKENLIW